MTSEKDALADAMALARRVDFLEMLVCRLLAALYERDAGGYRLVGKALGDTPLDAREGYALAQIREKMGDKQL